MRVFISSVRDGLEVERDALPGLLKAIGFDPVRFEDFSAQSTPSRQACMDGIDSSDAYLLLLGPKYGYVFPETGQSATHDEFARAQARGMRRLVFLKDGIDMEPKQVDFRRHVGDYGTGVFWNTFTDVTDLQTKVAAALRELEQAPGHLDFESLAQTPEVVWKNDWEDLRYSRHDTGGVAELHVLPVETTRVPGRILRTIPDRLTATLRSSGAVPAHVGLDQRQDEVGAVVEVAAPGQRRGMYDVSPRVIRGVRLAVDGQLSVWWDLPTDSMPMLEHQDLTDAIAQALRLVGLIGIDETRRYSVAVGVSGSMLSVVEGTLPSVPRQQVSMPFFGSDEPIRLLPDESVSAAAFDAGASEYARDLAAALIARFGTRR